MIEMTIEQFFDRHDKRDKEVSYTDIEIIPNPDKHFLCKDYSYIIGEVLKIKGLVTYNELEKILIKSGSDNLNTSQASNQIERYMPKNYRMERVIGKGYIFHETKPKKSK
jgi:hypothetical protein